MAGSLLGLLDNDDDRSQAADHAAHRAGGSGNSDMFKSILGSLVSSKERVSNEDIDEDGASPAPLRLHHTAARPRPGS